MLVVVLLLEWVLRHVGVCRGQHRNGWGQWWSHKILVLVCSATTGSQCGGLGFTGQINLLLLVHCRSVHTNRTCILSSMWSDSVWGVETRMPISFPHRHMWRICRAVVWCVPCHESPVYVQARICPTMLLAHSSQSPLS
jgi:hypothetical protein